MQACRLMILIATVLLSSGCMTVGRAVVVSPFADDAVAALAERCAARTGAGERNCWWSVREAQSAAQEVARRAVHRDTTADTGECCDHAAPPPTPENTRRRHTFPADLRRPSGGE